MEQRPIKTRLVGKQEVFNLLALGECTKLPVLLVGEPGVAKTQTLLDFAAAKYNYSRDEVAKKTFVIELDEGTKTSEIKGRVNMKSLLEDKEYKLDAPIADAEFILVNEVDKGTSGVRNTLLSIMREKAIFYGDHVKKCNWQVMAGSCNVIPDDELENPFWDRFVLTQKVERVGVDMMHGLWKESKIQEINVNVPTNNEISTCTIDKKHMKKFLDVIYGAVSDRSAFHVPVIVKAVKLVYGLDDIGAILKACELIAPSRTAEIAAKLESKRENNLRSQIESIKGVIEGGNDAYSQLFIGQVCDALHEALAMNQYKKIASGLLEDLLKEVSGSSLEYSQKEALLSTVSAKITYEDDSEKVKDLVEETINQM
jgi:MoxR-like ATPase